jgi:IclR family transcriptional regulator, carbohydrate utilization repressor
VARLHGHSLGGLAAEQITGSGRIIPLIEVDSHLTEWDVTEEYPMSQSANQQTSIQVMSRMFSLLDTLAQGQEAVSLKHISAQTGLHPSTAHRILNDLAAGRFVERSGPGSYRLGLRLLELGNLVRARLDLRDEAGPVMVELHRLLGQTVWLYARQDQDAVAQMRTAQERHGVSAQRITHQRAPLTDTVPGRAMLVKDSPAQLTHLCNQGASRPEAVQLDVQQARLQGALSGPDALTPGQQVTAAPIFNDEGVVIGALAAVGAPGQEQADAVRQAALQVSALMGHVSETR